MFLKLYKHNKRINSTLLPSEEDVLISGEVSLKSATSVDEPVFVMACGEEHMPYARICNYAECQGNYYWVVDTVQLNKNHIQIQCKLDPLTTYKNQILATKAYVIYSESHGNYHTLDNRITARTDNLQKTEVVKMNDLFSSDLNTIIEVTNGTGNSFDTPYLLTATETSFLKQELVTPDFLDEMKQYFSNPLENVIRAQLTPVTLGNLDNWGTLDRIQVGNYMLEAQGRRFSSSKMFKKFYTIPIPWLYSDFRNRSPYTNITLYMPFVGMVSLDTAVLYNTNSILIEVFVEPISGSVVYKIFADSPASTEVSVLIDTYSGNCNTETPIARVTTVNGVQGTVSAALVGASLATNPVMALVSGASLIDAFRQKTQINGALSSAIGSQLGQNIELTVWSSKTNAEPSEVANVIGLPYNSTAELGQLSGYTQTQNVSVSAIAREPILNEINAFLNGGIYIE